MGASGAARQRRRVSEERLHLVGERVREIGDLAARLEPPDELGRRRHADIGPDERHLELLPRVLRRGVEGGAQLGDERTAALGERVPETGEEPAALLLVGGAFGVAEQLGPGARHGGER